MNVQIIVALIGLLGVVVGVAGQIVIKRMESREKKRSRPHPHSVEGNGSSDHVLTKLRRWRIVIIVWMLASLASLAYVIWLPMSEFRLFVRAHAASVVMAAVSGLVILIVARPHSTLLNDHHSEGQPLQSQSRVWQDAIAYFALLMFLFTFCHVGWQFTNWMRLSRSTKLMTAGFDFLDSADYQQAITATTECGDDFHREATRIEVTLVGKQVPVGKVTPAEKEAIFDNGVLNDVGACYWITGRAAQMLHRTDEAKVAYTKAVEYLHARVWDPKGWFWSPAEDAKDLLQDLQ